MRALVPLLLLSACDAGLKCGAGTVEHDGYCVADPPAVDTDLPDTDPRDTDPPIDTDPPLDTDPPRPPVLAPFVGPLSLSEVSAIRGFCAEHDTVYGDVEVRGLELVRLDDLACLRRVNGNFSITAGALTSIQLPNLEAVTGNFYVSGPAQAAALQLPALREVGGNLTIGGGSPLRNLLAIDLTELVEVGDDLRLEDTLSLSSLTVPNLVHLGRHLWVRRNLALNTFTIAGVDQLGGALRIEGNPSLRNLDLPSLAHIGLNDTSELAIEDNSLLADLSGLAAIRTLSGPLVIRRNPALPTAAATALSAQLMSIGGVVVISDNGP
jgi:hypothetical protein